MRKIGVLFISLLVAYTCLASRAVDDFVHCEAVDSSSVAVVVVDLNNNEIIESYNADKSLLPASIMKTVTIASLIQKTGIDYRYTTNLFFQGEIQNDTIMNGNIIVVGSGDPSLNSVHEPFSDDFIKECVAVLQEKGIKKIAGRIVVEQNVFEGSPTPESWVEADMKYGYGTGCHAFNFENNAYFKGAQSYSVDNPAEVFVSKLKANSLLSEFKWKTDVKMWHHEKNNYCFNIVPRQSMK